MIHIDILIIKLYHPNPIPPSPSNLQFPPSPGTSAKDKIFLTDAVHP